VVLTTTLLPVVLKASLKAIGQARRATTYAWSHFEEKPAMPVSIIITDDGLGVLLTAAGNLSFQEVLAANEHFFKHHAEAFLHCRYWFADYAQVEHTDVDFTQIRQLAAMHVSVSKLNPQLIVAVHSSADFIFGMARMWESFAAETGWTTQVFRSAEEAKDWLRTCVKKPLTFK
jgi:hypothetical protein